MDFKLRNLNNVNNHVYNIWQQTGQSNFLETVFFYHSQHAFGFGPASSRSFSIQLGRFFFFKRSNQLRIVIIICCVFKVILPVRIRLKIVTFKLLKNDQVILSTFYADLSAFLHLCTFTLGEGIKLVCFAFLAEDSLPMLCGEAAEGLQPDFQRYQMLKDRET